MKFIRLLGAALVALFVPAIVVAQPELVPNLGAAGCRFARPAEFAGTLKWEGSCVAGLAAGLGVLRAYVPQQPPKVFYGRMAAGQLVLGVIELEGGYVAGEFVAGRRKPSDDREVFIRAFNEASVAAKEAAARFRKAGNEASARYYDERADQLAAQMD